MDRLHDNVVYILWALSFFVTLAAALYSGIRYINLEDQVKKIKDRIASNNYQMITIEHL